jgi:hypothetical protein
MAICCVLKELCILMGMTNLPLVPEKGTLHICLFGCFFSV